MRQFFSALHLILVFGITSACSAVEEVSNSINYIEKATDYINKIHAFTNEAPPLIEKAATDESALNQLTEKLEEMEQEITEFNQLTPPDFAKEIHAQILQHNQVLEATIKQYTDHIKDKNFDPQTLQDSQLMKQMDELSEILEKLQNIGG